MPIEALKRGVDRFREIREARRRHEFVLSITHQFKDAGKWTESARFPATRKKDRVLDDRGPENYRTEVYYYSELPIAEDQEKPDALVHLTAGVEKGLQVVTDDYDGLKDLYLVALPALSGAPSDLQICGFYRSNRDVDLADPTVQDILYIDNGKWVADKPFALAPTQLNFDGTDVVACDLSLMPI